MIRYQNESSADGDQAGPQRVDQLQPHGVAAHRIDAVREELRVEADLERLARVGGGKRLLRLADVLALGRDRQLTLGEAQSQRRVAQRHHAARRTTSRSSARGRSTSISNDSGSSRPHVGELPVDPAGRQPRVAGRRRRRVLVDAERDGLRAAGDPRELGEGAGRDDRLEVRARLARAAVSLNESRYESVAAISSRVPSNRTWIPVSTGRDSSFEADRATRSIVSSSEAVAIVCGARSTDGSRGKSSAAKTFSFEV